VLGETVVLLVLLVSPPCHHVTIASEIVVRVLREEPVLEATDDILIVDVGDGGMHLEETLGVGPQGLIHLLLHLG
jgi:hypothetical protein